MSAGLLRRVVDTVQRYRAVLGSDELVQSRRSSLAIYRNRVLVGPSPWDTQRVEGIGEKAEDVLGPITEVVPHALDSAIVGDDTAAVAVYESEDELLGLMIDNSLLPLQQRDLAVMLAAGPMLWQ